MKVQHQIALSAGTSPALALPMPVHGVPQAQREDQLFGRVQVRGTLPSAPGLGTKEQCRAQ